MGSFIIKKGLNLPISGEPQQKIDTEVKLVSKVGFVFEDFPFLKPLLEVKEGDKLKVGDPLLLDSKSGLKFTSIAGGTVKAINRGEKRKLLSLVVEVDKIEEYKEFKSFSINEILNLDSQTIKDQLIEAGLWSFFRTRPFSKIPSPNKVPRSIFVTGMDTDPLSPRSEIIIHQNKSSFKIGLDVIARLANVLVHVCVSPNQLESFKIPHGQSNNIIFHFFSGLHPAGLVGTHIHHIDPITSVDDEVWHIGYQDVIALGKFFETGKIFLDRYVSLAGPQVNSPRIIKTRKGADLIVLTSNQLKQGENRIISGSPLYGNLANDQISGFLGNFSNVVTVLKEDRRRFFHGFLTPGFNDFSVKPIMMSRMLGKSKLFSFGTLLNGSVRDVVPIGSYEQVMPLNFEMNYLVKSLLAGDAETAEKLGALELAEEDLALPTFVCPGKNDIGKALVKVLRQIEKENS